MTKFIFLSPYIEEKIWGGHRLSAFGINSFNKKIGEAWIISGYENKSSHILNGRHKGMTLKDFYSKYPYFFDKHLSTEYPLLIKFLDCHDNLSVQVHPNNEYSISHNIKTKNEAWYVIDAPVNPYIIYGHNARNKKEFNDMVTNKQWSKLLNKKQINTNDIINVPAGTIHALTTGLFVLEIQEPIDLTYRLYDYGRNNKNRKLDVKKVIDSSNIPFVNNYPNEQKNELHTPQFDMHIIHNKRYKNYNFPQAKWLQYVVIDGDGRIDIMNKIKKGDCFISSANKTKFSLIGNLTLAISYIRK